MMDTISQRPRKKATTKVIRPRNERPKTVGKTPAACMIAELRMIALTIIAKAILLLARSISFINSGRFT